MLGERRRRRGRRVEKKCKKKKTILGKDMYNLLVLNWIKRNWKRDGSMPH